MGYVYAVFAIVCVGLFIASVITWVADGTDMTLQVIMSVFTSIACIIAAV